MTALQVRDCPDDVYELLRQCAKRENRSISQQALTIIEDYLKLREVPPANCNIQPFQPEEIDYAEKRQRLFASLAELPPLPHTEKTPDSACILAENREGEAR